MPISLAELFVAAKDGIGDYLVTTTGLRPADEVTVRTAPITPEAFAGDMLILGDITAPQTKPGLATREAKPTMPGWIVVTRSGDDESVIRATRARAAALMGHVERAVVALAVDTGGARVIPPPGGLSVTTSGMEESPVDWQGAAARRATVPFTLAWTSHIT